MAFFCSQLAKLLKLSPESRVQVFSPLFDKVLPILPWDGIIEGANPIHHQQDAFSNQKLDLHMSIRLHAKLFICALDQNLCLVQLAIPR